MLLLSAAGSDNFEQLGFGLTIRPPLLRGGFVLLGYLSTHAADKFYFRLLSNTPTGALLFELTTHPDLIFRKGESLLFS